MGFKSIALLILYGISFGLLYTWSVDPNVDPAERHVLTTTVYSIGGSTALNTVCAILAYNYGLVEPAGSETEACIPYSIAAAAVIARMHMYATGGYTDAE